MKKSIVLVAGARPNFMKVAPLYREMKRHGDYFDVLLVHTGQHYDSNMSDAFFRDLGLPDPDVYLGVGSGSHSEQTAGVMVGFEKVCFERSPDIVVVVGDVNSTMACAVTAAKSGIPVAHIEAGLRSRDRSMPEEINRLVTDCISDLFFTPSKDADENLLKEGHPAERIYRVGNIMIDSLKFAMPQVALAGMCERIGVAPKEFGLTTLHRPANVDTVETLGRIVDVLNSASDSLKMVFPVHPRTRRRLDDFGFIRDLQRSRNIVLLEPMGYIEFMSLLVNSAFVLTDSGGLQEETTYFGIPCLTLRPNTERPITIAEGTNELVTLDTANASVQAICEGRWKKGSIPEFWDGKTAERITDVLRRLFHGEGLPFTSGRSGT